jgi:hypothetical protein
LIPVDLLCSTALTFTSWCVGGCVWIRSSFNMLKWGTRMTCWNEVEMLRGWGAETRMTNEEMLRCWEVDMLKWQSVNRCQNFVQVKAYISPCPTSTAAPALVAPICSLDCHLSEHHKWGGRQQGNWKATRHMHE